MESICCQNSIRPSRGCNAASALNFRCSPRSTPVVLVQCIIMISCMLAIVCFICLDKRKNGCKIVINLFISLKNWLGAQKNRLNESVLLSAHNICFAKEIRKIVS